MSKEFEKWLENHSDYPDIEDRERFYAKEGYEAGQESK